MSDEQALENKEFDGIVLATGCDYVAAELS